MAGREITQKVIDFQFSRIQMKNQEQMRLSDSKLRSAKFTQWNLNNIIEAIGLTNKSQYVIKWVGYQQNSHLQAFIYSLIKFCKSPIAEQNGIFIKLKYCIYQLAARFLKVNDQKLIVEFLCSLQYTKNLIQFLNKNKLFNDICEKIFKSYLQSSKIQYESQLQDIQIFAQNFDFLKFQLINRNVALIHQLDDRIYLINQKNCFFIVQAEASRRNLIIQRKINQNNTEIKTRNQFTPSFCRDQKLLKNQTSQKKLYEYSVPKFIVENLAKKKKKRQARFTDMQIQEEACGQKKYARGKIGETTQTPNDNSYIFFSSLKNTAVSNQSIENPETKSKTQSKQKIGRYRLYYKQSTNRSKTGLLQSNQRNKDNSAPKTNINSINDITFDEKQIRKNSMKKIELNLKKFTQIKNKSNSNLKNLQVQIPRYQSIRKIDQLSSSHSLTPISNSNGYQKIILRYNGT